MAMFSSITAPGAYLVDLIPARKAKLRHPSLWMHVQVIIVRYLPEWFPGTGFLQDGKKYHQILMESIVKPHQYVVEQMVG